MITRSQPWLRTNSRILPKVARTPSQLAAPSVYPTGRDGGIDLRHALATGQSWVVQCKHYAGSRFADLRRSVLKEVDKLHRLKPQRYVLATSCGLTPGNVDELCNLLSPYCTSKHDILGKTDLNGILRANGDIERRHPKLWITSEAVLSRVLQNDVFVQSEMTRESILRRLSLYVYTSRFDDARKQLNADRVCITLLAFPASERRPLRKCCSSST